ncbi:hypothetical protein AMS68_002996 [Peltaster fructicola]|uniref:PAS-like domain-containing protein n=1 Tax=Peltaster fructicola TaxID=286661 RepID=A0A6H0XS77_9PEZI|nr:hypothetical protein AMS68_002996 [Peltaster fructicola]
MPSNASQPSIFTPRDQFTSVPAPGSSSSTIAARPQSQLDLPTDLGTRSPKHRRHNSDVGLQAWSTPDDKQNVLDEAEQKRSSSEIVSPTAKHNFAIPTTPSSAKRKRRLETAESAPASEPASKKPRLKPRPNTKLDSFSLLSTPSYLEPDLAPPSPLFFSHSPRPRPHLPPRFSSSEAGARMLSKARIEDAHVKTVSLTRGTVSTSAIPTSSPAITASAVRRSLERSSTGRSHSPESSSGRDHIGANASAHLNSIGIIELLEQDDRPTFIVDLSDSINYGPGALHPLFTNLSLRSVDGLSEYIAGTSSGEQSPDATTFIQFKSWLLSATINGESLNVCLPPFTYAGMSWSCSTLRKRLRIISGAFVQATQTRASTNHASIRSSSSRVPSASTVVQESSDYFGEDMPVTGSAPTSAGVVSSIEAPKTADTRVESPPSNDLVDTTTSPTVGSSAQISPNIRGYIENVHNSIGLPVEDLPSFDWTRIPISDTMPPHVLFARSVDWAATSLGPIELWTPDLRQMCNLIMASPHPAAMYWGEDLVAIYNEAYVLLAGQKHPKLMGPELPAWHGLRSGMMSKMSSLVQSLQEKRR